MKLKSKSSAIPSQRYLFFTLVTTQPVTFEDARNAAMSSILNWLGEERAGRAGVWVMKNLWNEKAQAGVIRCAPGAADDVKLALALVHQIGDSKAIFNVTKVSGTLKGGRKIGQDEPD